MQIKQTLVALAMMAPIALLAQPTMTRAWFGDPGDKISTNFSSTVLPEGDAGADVNWDFKALVPDTISANTTYVNPGDTPFGASYPESNVCWAIEAFGVYNYLNLSNDILENYGSASTFSTTEYSNPETILQFPFTYNDNFTDDWAASTSFLGVTTFATGTTVATVDGYGSLDLPGGSFENVLRVKVVNEAVDSTDLGLGITEKIHSNTTSYYWYSADHPGPLCYRDYNETYQVAIVPPLPNDTMFFEPDSTFAFDPTATSSRVDFFVVDAFSLRASPNPFVDQIALKFTAESSEDFVFELRSITGQTVFRTQINTVLGQNSLTVHPGSLPPGAYTGLLSSASTGTSIKLIKL